MKTQAFLATTTLAVLLTIGCARQESEEDAVPAPAPVATATKPVNVPPPVITPVTVKVTLSPKAEEEVRRTGAVVSVEATYAGDPNKASSGKANEMGVIELGKAREELKESGTVTFSKDVIDKTRLGWTIGQPQVMINVFSGTKPSPANILGCKFYWETLFVAGKAPVEIACSLLSENPAP